jgi:hypothetical protein
MEVGLNFALRSLFWSEDTEVDLTFTPRSVLLWSEETEVHINFASRSVFMLE